MNTKDKVPHDMKSLSPTFPLSHSPGPSSLSLALSLLFAPRPGMCPDSEVLKVSFSVFVPSCDDCIPDNKLAEHFVCDYGRPASTSYSQYNLLGEGFSMVFNNYAAKCRHAFPCRLLSQVRSGKRVLEGLASRRHTRAFLFG